MLSISDAAAEKLSEMLRELQPSSEQQDSDIWCFRLQARGDDLALRLDVPWTDDAKFRHLDQLVLVVDTEVCEACEGFLLDYGHQRRFYFRYNSELN